MYKKALERLVIDGEVSVHSVDGKMRRSARYMTDDDIVQPAKQLTLRL